MPKVSVVIPLYNSARFIAASVTSVLQQSFQDFEVIIVNDGSDDDSLNVLEKFTDPRLKIYTQQRLGPAAARNFGISQSAGEYIALIDADDIWLPHKLEKQVKHLNDAQNIALSFCYSAFVDQDGKHIGIGTCPALDRIKFPSALMTLCFNPVGCGSTPLIRRSILEEIALPALSPERNQYFDETLWRAEDVECWIRIIGVKPIEGLNTVLVHYRVMPGSLSSDLEQVRLSLELLRNKVFKNTPNLATHKNIQISKAFHLRYLAQSSLMRGEKRFAALSFLARAYAAYPLFVFIDPVTSLLITVASIVQLIFGENLTNKMISIAATTMAKFGVARFRIYQ